MAPLLEEDVAFSSIAQNEIGHARALYALLAREEGAGDADELALDRQPAEYRSAPLVEMQLVPDWAATIARHVLYETADAVRVEALTQAPDPEVAGLAAKIQREEAYHLMHAEMWAARLLATPDGAARLREAAERLWPYALGVLEPALWPAWRERLARLLPWELSDDAAVGRGQRHSDLAALWEEMTMVRRSQPAGVSW